LSLDEREMRKIRGNEISMVFQEPMTSLNPLLTSARQLIEPIILHRNIRFREARERAVELLRLGGNASPERRMSDYPHQLSGGMRQRVMIAIAIACNPEAAHRRRADNGPRCHHSGANPGPDAQSACTSPLMACRASMTPKHTSESFKSSICCSGTPVRHRPGSSPNGESTRPTGNEGPWPNAA
jgi:hypothetical protein